MQGSESKTLMEKRHHFIGCSLIRLVNEALKLPQIVTLTSQNLYHRFYVRKSLGDYDSFSIAMACFLLGAKIENKPQVLREVINEFFMIYIKIKELRYYELDLGSDLYSLWKQELLALECEVLKELGFACYEDLDHPHFFMLEVWKSVEIHCHELINCNNSNNFPQYILNMLNDAMFFDLVIRYDCVYTVVAIILLAFQALYPVGEQAVHEMLCRQYSLDVNALRTLKQELMQSFTEVPIVHVDESIDWVHIIVDKDSKIIKWLEPIANVPFLQMTEERSK